MHSAPLETLEAIGELAFIKRLHRQLSFHRGLKPQHVLLSIGDDAALIHSPQTTAVLTCDSLIENVHFRRSWFTVKDIGHKAAAVTLSDLAAMGAQPQALLCGLALPPKTLVTEALGLLRSLHRLGEQYGAPLLGGDLVGYKGPWALHVTAIGCLKSQASLKKGAALLQHRGEVGDVILSSGYLGAAATALWGLSQNLRLPRSILQHQLKPTPQITLGLLLAKTGLVKTCTDISDGLSRDVMLLPQKKLGVMIHKDNLPIAASVKRWCQQHNVDAKAFALDGGEDYELLCAVSQKDVQKVCSIAQSYGYLLTAVGQIIKKPGLWYEEIGKKTFRVASKHAGYDTFA